VTSLDRTLDLVLQGATNKDIAAELNVTTRTAKAYLHRLFVRHGINGACGGRRGRLIALYRHRLTTTHTSAARLSTRDLRIIGRVASGAINRVAAEQLGFTEYTLKNYLREIYDKIGVDNRWELAVWYFAHCGRPRVLASSRSNEGRMTSSAQLSEKPNPMFDVFNVEGQDGARV